MTVRGRAGAPVWIFTGVLGASAATLWITKAAEHPAATSVLHIPWILLLAAYVAASVLMADVEVGGQVHSVDVSGVLLVVGLCFVSPTEHLAARLVAVVLVMAVYARIPLVKLAFNIASDALGLAVAVMVFGAIRGASDVAAPRAWLASLCGAVAAYLVVTIAFTAVISLTSGRFERSSVLLAVSGLMTIANTGLGLITVDVMLVDWRGLCLIGGLAVTMWTGYRQFVRFRQRHANLQLMYQFTRSLSDATDVDDVADRALTMAEEMMRAGVAALVFRTADGIVSHGLEQGETIRRTSTEEDLALEDAVLSGEGTALVREGQRHPLRPYLEARGWRDLVACPIEGDQPATLIVANRLADASTFDEDDAKFLETLAGQTAIALRASDLFDQLRAEAADKAHQATHDALTGLGNRTLLIQQLEEELVHADATNLVAVYFIDLDGFKEVNDALGHHTGDLLLVEVARRMRQQLSRRATIARLGGDEFGLVVAGLGSGQEARAVGSTIRDLVQQPVEIEGMTLEVRASVGASMAPVHGEDASILFQRADIAMYSAKERRTGVELYEEDLDHSSARRLSLVADLRHAIEEGELVLNYQPQAEAGTGRIIGVEALTRWIHPTFGFVPPDEFIPIAEQTGLIQPLTMWALRTALRDLAVWREHEPELRMSVNLSARSLMDVGLVADVAHELAELDMPASALTLELTESSVMADPERSLVQLARLRSMGIRLAIDDFGTGYSSLSYLKRLPVDEVKIDKSFVLAMSKDTDDAVIVRSTIDLADNLGLEVVAEGVEDDVTWDLLVNLGCEIIQGYHLSRPMPAADMPGFLARVEPRVRTRADVLSFRRPAGERFLSAVAAH